MSLIQFETQAGRPILTGKIIVTPIAKVLRLQIPGLQGGVIWNRPVAVLVEREDGSQEMIHVRDVTRLLQLTLAGLAAGMMIFWLLSRGFRRKP